MIASPISAVTVAMVAALGTSNVGLVQILMIIIPATLLGVFIGTLSVAWRGVTLSEDPVYLERVRTGTFDPATAPVQLEGTKLRNARGSLLLFMTAIVVVVVLGIFPGIRNVETGQAVMIIMLATAGLIMLLFNASAEATVKNSIMRGGISAVISILGISWMGSSFFEGNRVEIVAGISGLIQQAPWVFAVGLFLLSILLISQAATVVTLMPVAIALGMPAAILVGVYPAVNGSFFLPTYGTVIAAVAFDRTGSTRIGAYLLNHSFMLPGLVTTIATTLIAVAIAHRESRLEVDPEPRRSRHVENMRDTTHDLQVGGEMDGDLGTAKAAGRDAVIAVAGSVEGEGHDVHAGRQRRLRCDEACVTHGRKGQDESGDQAGSAHSN